MPDASHTRRWPGLRGLRELDFGEAHRISGPALHALSALSKLSRLACLVNGSLPASISSLAQLQALEIRWFADADGGTRAALAPRNACQGSAGHGAVAWNVHPCCDEEQCVTVGMLAARRC